MGRVTIDVDEGLVAQVMARYRLRTPGEAVEVALRHVLGQPKSTAEVLEMFGAIPDFEVPNDQRPT